MSIPDRARKSRTSGDGPQGLLRAMRVNGRKRPSISPSIVVTDMIQPNTNHPLAEVENAQRREQFLNAVAEVLATVAQQAGSKDSVQEKPQ